MAVEEKKGEQVEGAGDWPQEIDFYRRPDTGQITGWADDPRVREMANPLIEGGPYEIQTYVLRETPDAQPGE